MKMQIEVPDSMSSVAIVEYRGFLQAMTNRILVGELRYGPPDRRKQYMKRLTLELKRYRENGNVEHLINIANYGFLESRCPQNRKHHFDPEAASATRLLMDGIA